MKEGDWMVNEKGRLVKIISLSKSKIAGNIQYRNGKITLTDVRRLKPLTFKQYLKCINS